MGKRKKIGPVQRNEEMEFSNETYFLLKWNSF